MALHTTGFIRGVLKFRMVATLVNIGQRVQVVLGNNLMVGAKVPGLVKLGDGSSMAVATDRG